MSAQLTLVKRCPRLLSEVWTPGSVASPSGPPRDMESQCILMADGHTEHLFGVAEERSR